MLKTFTKEEVKNVNDSESENMKSNLGGKITCVIVKVKTRK